MSKLFDILLLINNNDRVTQRFLADESGISLGGVNSIIKNLEEQNYIVKTGNTKSDYCLTMQGIDLLERFVVENNKRRIRLEDSSKNQVVRQAVILAAGDASEFGKPVGFLKVGQETVISRIIKLLDERNIDEIIIVAGYKKEYFLELEKSNPKVRVVINDRYKYTGTMYSLSLCKDLVHDDFILIKNNLVFQERAIRKVIECDDHTSLLVTSESGSGHEAFVEIREDRVYKLAKDRNQFNKIDGELVGVMKISFNFYTKMLKQFEGNKNPYINCEYTLMDVGREYKVGYIKLDDLAWYEITTKKNLKKVRGYVYSSILRRDDLKRMDHLKKELVRELDIKIEDIRSIEAAGGMTNKNYKVDINGELFILRIAGVGTENMINRVNERNNSIIGSILGLNTDTLYFNERTGVKVSKFIDNAETLNPATAKKENNMEIVAGLLKKLHFSCVDFDNEFNVFREIEKYEKLVKDVNGKFYDEDEYPIIRDRVMNLENELNRIGRDLYTCHNDTVAENFIKGVDSNYLIDWEYAGMNDPMWDIAGHIIECDFNEDEEELFKNKYFSIDYDLKKGTEKASEVQEEKILMFKICQDFLWTIWTVYKEAKGVYFGDYGPMRYERAKVNLEKFYSKYM